jgi:hypothetical protein
MATIRRVSSPPAAPQQHTWDHLYLKAVQGLLNYGEPISNITKIWVAGPRDLAQALVPGGNVYLGQPG